MSTLETLLKTIVDESVMTDKAKVAFSALLNRMTQLQLIENVLYKMREKSQQFTWKGFKEPQGRWLSHEANLFPEASN